MPGFRIGAQKGVDGDAGLSYLLGTGSDDGYRGRIRCLTGSMVPSFCSLSLVNRLRKGYVGGVWLLMCAEFNFGESWGWVWYVWVVGAFWLFGARVLGERECGCCGAGWGWV